MRIISAAFLTVTAACVPTAEDSIGNGLRIHSVVADDLNAVSFVLENRSSDDLCFSSVFADKDFVPNPFRISDSDAEILPIAIDNFDETLPAITSAQLKSGDSVRLVTSLTTHFAIENASWIEFDISLPVFPCDLAGAASIQREYLEFAEETKSERLYGVQELRENGLREVTSKRVRVLVEN